jgi:hypothetical protein
LIFSRSCERIFGPCCCDPLDHLIPLISMIRSTGQPDGVYRDSPKRTRNARSKLLWRLIASLPTGGATSLAILLEDAWGRELRAVWAKSKDLDLCPYPRLSVSRCAVPRLSRAAGVPLARTSGTCLRLGWIVTERAQTSRKRTNKTGRYTRRPLFPRSDPVHVRVLEEHNQTPGDARVTEISPTDSPLFSHALLRWPATRRSPPCGEEEREILWL